MRSPDPSELTAVTPFGAAARIVIARLCDQMMSNLPGTRSGDDIEALHDMRVASRRLRAAFRVFCACFPVSEFASVSEQTGAVTQALGQVRDQDVFLEFLRGQAQTHPEAEIDWIIDRENQIREGARVKMLDSLATIEHDDLAGSIARLLDHASMTANESRNRFARQARDMIEPRIGKIVKMGKALPDPEKVAELHLMRIAAKRLRYTMEAFLPCFGDPLAQMVSSVKLLQEQLGEVHDCDVWVEKLKTYQNQPGLSETRIAALEALVEERQARRAQVYNDALSHWRELKEQRFAARLSKLIGTPPINPKFGKREAFEMTEPKEKTTEEAATEAKTRRRTAVAKKPAPSVAPVEPVVAAEPETPKNPLLAEIIAKAREAASSAAAKIEPAEDQRGLSKQFGKVQSVLDALQPKTEELKAKSAEKVEKLVNRLADCLEPISNNGKLSNKKAAKLGSKVRELRKRIEKRTA